MFSLFKMFSRKNMKLNEKIYSPISGKIISISNIPDQAFASKLLGDGVGINSKKKGVLVAPIEGMLEINPTLHAFTIESEKGFSVLVHLGIDTLNLCGQGFEQLTVNKKKVEVGEAIIKYDLENIENSSLITIVVVLESQNFKFKTKLEGEKVEELDTIIEFKE